MTSRNSGYIEFRNIFEGSIKVTDISVPLVSYSLQDSPKNVKHDMTKKRFDAAGVKKNGEIVGYTLINNLKEHSKVIPFNSFKPTDFISDSTPLLELLPILKKKSRIFVLHASEIVGIVTVSDLQKPTFRMLLFGLISILETHTTELIKEKFPNESWVKFLNSKRMAKVNELFQQRKENNEEIDLCDCIQFGDGRDILKKGKLIHKINFKSNEDFVKFFKNIENLRDLLAHSQSIESERYSWIQIIDFTTELLNILEFIESREN